MKTFEKYCLASLLGCAFVVAGVVISPETQHAEADTQIPGYTKHCPVYYYGNLGPDLLFLTQNSSHCGSDYVWTRGYYEITFGAANCGWPIDCLDPIFVDPYGNVLVLNEQPNQDLPVVSIQPVPETDKMPVPSRMVVTTTQDEYIPSRSGAPGNSQHEAGRFVKASDKVAFTGDQDFVVKADFGNDDVRYFRVLELKLSSENSADDQVIRFGKELDPAVKANTVAAFEAKVLESNDQTHVLQLLDDQEERKFLATTVTPVSAR